MDVFRRQQARAFAQWTDSKREAKHRRASPFEKNPFQVASNVYSLVNSFIYTPRKFGTKNPDFLQDYAHVVPRTTQHRIHLVAFGAFQVIPPQQSGVLDVPDHRLDRLSALEQTLQPCIHAAHLTGIENLRIRHAETAIATVHEHFLRLGSSNPLNLTELSRERMNIIRIAGKRHRNSPIRHEPDISLKPVSTWNTKS